MPTAAHLDRPAKKSSAKAMPSNDELLDIAAQAFADRGYAGARVDEIAKAAGVNKATLYYRIGDKDALYSAVLKRIFSAKIVRMDAMLEAVEDAEQRLVTFATILVDSEHPQHFTTIMLREIADGGRNLPDDVLPLMARTIGTLEKTIAQGVAEERFNPVNPFLLHMMLVGACALYAANGPIRRRVAKLAPKGTSLNIDLSLHNAAEAIANILLDGVRKQ